MSLPGFRNVWSLAHKPIIVAILISLILRSGHRQARTIKTWKTILTTLINSLNFLAPHRISSLKSFFYVSRAGIIPKAESLVRNIKECLQGILGVFFGIPARCLLGHSSWDRITYSSGNGCIWIWFAQVFASFWFEIEGTPCGRNSQGQKFDEDFLVHVL